MRHAYVRFLATLVIVSLTAVAGCASQTEDDSANVGESSDALCAGTKLSPYEAATLMRQVGFPESAIGPMVCTILYESAYHPNCTPSKKNANGTVDYGLFQINSVHLGEAGCPSKVSALYDAETNARCAFAVYNYQYLDAWTGYKTHKSTCDAYTAPGSDVGVDSCFSGTLDKWFPPLTCVESKFDGLWYQCSGGNWRLGGDNGSGPGGECDSQYPL